MDGVDRAHKIEKLRSEPSKLTVEEEEKIGAVELMMESQLRTLVQIFVDSDNKEEKEMHAEMQRSNDMIEINLEVDIYSIGFLTFLKF